MKKLIALAIITASLAVTAHAQTFGGGVQLIGTSNAPLVVGTSVFTNYAYVTIPLKSVVLSGITETNETVIYSYGFTIAGQTNVIIMGSVTNSFAAGVGTGTWTTNIPPQTYTVPVIPWAQAAIGNHTNTIYVP